MEMTWKTGRHWAREAKIRKEKLEMKIQPHWERLSGPTEEAKKARKELEARMDATLEASEGRVEDWSYTCERAHEVAMATLGPQPERDVRPWLRGRETEKKDIEEK